MQPTGAQTLPVPHVLPMLPVPQCLGQYLHKTKRKIKVIVAQQYSAQVLKRKNIYIIILLRGKYTTCKAMQSLATNNGSTGSRGSRAENSMILRNWQVG